MAAKAQLLAGLRPWCLLRRGLWAIIIIVVTCVCAESPPSPERLVVVAVYPFTAIEPGDLSLGGPTIDL